MANFKPEFGNKTHIEVCKLLKQLAENDKLLDKKMSEVANINKISKEMKGLISQVIFYLEQETGDK